MVGQVCLDSDIIIELLRGNQQVKSKLETLNYSISISAISIFEIWMGKKEDDLESFINSFYIINFDKDAAVISANIRNKLKKEGEQIDLRDIFIASVCIANNIPLWTNNKKHFERMSQFGLALLN